MFKKNTTLFVVLLMVLMVFLAVTVGKKIVKAATTVTFDPNVSALNPSDSVVGSELLMDSLIISDSAGNDVTYFENGQGVGSYGGGPSNVLDSCVPSNWGIGDTAVPNYPARRHQYQYTFTDSQTVNQFSLRALDYGDYMPYGACPGDICALNITAYDATNAIIDTDTISFSTSSARVNHRISAEYGDMSTAGDICLATEGQPGNDVLEVSGSGISRVTVQFANDQSMDPNIAFSDITYTLEDPISSPVPSPEVSPSPSSQPGNQSALGTNIGSCQNNEFEATYDVTENGQPREGVQVTFVYNGTTLTSNTNAGGRARVFFSKSGNGSVTANASGYPGQSSSITLPTDCPVNPPPTGSVLGATTDNSARQRAGQVLGITTLANTGAAEQRLALLGLLTGAALVALAGLQINKSR
jgi:hypothetical protein